MLKITGGYLRGRKLKTLGDNSTRPTLERVRSAIFDMLGQNFGDLTVLDAFAGSGAMGIEALSRGCERATLIDSSKAACELLHVNVKILSLDRCVEVIRCDCRDFLRSSRLKYDIIFIDPPYNVGLIQSVIDSVVQFNALKSGGKIVLESHPEEAIALPEELYVLRCRNYGKKCKVTILEFRGKI